MNDALRLEGIRKRFGVTVALDGVDLAVRSGSVHALLGENGAGKSTLMQVAARLLRPDAGTVTSGGRVSVRRARDDPPRERGVVVRSR